MVLEFTPKPAPNPSRLTALATPPTFRLEGPEWGWIDGFVEHANLDDPFVVTFSEVYPPLVDVWAWSAAVACCRVRPAN